MPSAAWPERARWCLNALAGIFCFALKPIIWFETPNGHSCCLNALAGIFCFAPVFVFSGPSLPVLASQCPRGHFLFRSPQRRSSPVAPALGSQCPRGHFLFRSPTSIYIENMPGDIGLNALAGIFCFARFRPAAGPLPARYRSLNALAGIFCFALRFCAGPTPPPSPGLNALAGIFCFARRSPGWGCRGRSLNALAGIFCFAPDRSDDHGRRDRHVSMPSRAFFVSLFPSPASFPLLRQAVSMPSRAFFVSLGCGPG